MSIVTGANTGLTNSANALATTPTIANITIPTANNEISYTFPNGTKRFAIQNRRDAMIKISYSAGESGSTYYTIWPGAEYTEDNILYSASITIFMQSPQPGQIAEIRSWV